MTALDVATRALSFLPSKAYEAAVSLRVSAYERGLVRTHRLARPVISVGNITHGGTGKTPIVAVIAEMLRGAGYRVAILTRGYGRTGRGRIALVGGDGTIRQDASEAAGDEPVMLARRLPGVHVIVDANRVEAGRWAEKALDPDVFLLDDGFQHLRLARDLNLLVVDAMDPFGGREMPPFGRLREPIGGVRRADAAIVTRAGRPFDREDVGHTLRAACGEALPIVYMDHTIVGIRSTRDGSVVPPSALRGERAAVLTALGNPAVLLDDLTRAGVSVVTTRLLRDHHPFTQSDVDSAVASACRANANMVLITTKDEVKLERLDLSAMEFKVVDIEIAADQTADLRRLVLDAVLKARDRR